MNQFDIINQLDTNHINQLMKLYQQTWWAKERTRDEVDIMLKTSMSFGLIQNETNDLVGYARVLTDDIRYAYIFDVVVDHTLRKNGLGKLLLQAITQHTRFKNIKYFELTCVPDMVPFYQQFGFSENYGGKVVPMRYSNEAKV